MAQLGNPVLPLVPDWLPFGPVVACKKTFADLAAVAQGIVDIRAAQLKEETESTEENSKLFVDLLLKASDPEANQSLSPVEVRRSPEDNVAH